VPARLHEVDDRAPVPGAFEQERRDHGDGFGIVQAQSARPALPGQVGRHVNEQPFLFVFGEKHLPMLARSRFRRVSGVRGGVTNRTVVSREGSATIGRWTNRGAGCW
jgi:hypothetical protein